MICKNCGSQVPEGAKYCIYCGTRVTDESVEYKEEVIYDVPEEERTAAQSAAENPGQVYTYGAGQQTYQPKKSSSGKPLIIVAVAFVVILLLIAAMVKIGLGLFADRGGDNYTDEPTQTETMLELSDTQTFAEFMMGTWVTRSDGYYFDVSEDEEFYYYETNLYIENTDIHGWDVADNVFYIYYSDDLNDPGYPYLYITVIDEDTIEIYSYEESKARKFYRG